MKITDFVKKDYLCHFNYFRQGNLYYTVINIPTCQEYIFPIPIEDLDGAEVHDTEKSVFLMRYIRKALEEKTLVPYDNLWKS